MPYWRNVIVTEVQESQAEGKLSNFSDRKKRKRIMKQD